MKGKSKGLGSIKMLALGHGEKVVMALIAMVAGYLLYSSTSVESLPSDKQASNLESLASTVSNTIRDYGWDRAVEQAQGDIRIHQPLPADRKIEIDPLQYLPPRYASFDAPVVPPTELRKDPEILPVYDFEGHGITGLFAFISKEEADRRMLEEMKSEAERRREAEQEAERQREEELRGTRRSPRGGGEPGFFEGGMGIGLAENENRRAVNITLPPAGVDLDGTELIRRMSMAVVLAKVPLPEQLKQYQNALANTRTYDPQFDIPRYLGYYVERAEVRPDAELEWRPVELRNGRDSRRLPLVAQQSIQFAIHDWAQGLIDDFDPRYGDQVLTFPLPPLVGQNLDDMARHSEVPLASEMEEELLEEEDDGLPEDLTENPDALFGDNTGAGLRGGGEFGEMGRRPMGGPGGRSEFGAMGRMGGGRGMGGEFGARGMGGEFGGRGGRGMGGEFGGRGMGMGMAGGSAISVDENGEPKVVVPFVMLRFFDLTVQPGKRYKYRVRLIVEDPNYEQPPSVLDPEVLARERKRARVGEWSEPSPTISIPQAGTIRIAEAKPAGARFNTEPTAQMLVESFGIDERRNALKAYKELEARRGAVMNYQGPVEMLVEQGRFIEKVDDFEIDTGVVVLDIDVEERFTRDLAPPATALMMDSSGRMYLRDELHDEREVALHRAVFEETGQPGGGRGEFGGEFGFPEMGRGRGGR